jgi:ABC-type dipeptide/oligopeptide/nickel transport system permease component
MGNFEKGHIMKKIIMLFVFAIIVFFVTGCGPGQPFEIEGRHTPQSETTLIYVAK